MSLRIAFDLDGVLADMDSELRRQADLVFGEPVSEPSPRGSQSAPAAGSVDTKAGGADETSVPGVPPARIPLTMRQQRRLWKHVGGIENFWETLDECEPGAVRRLAEVAADRRWEIIFLTKRPRSAGASPQMQTQRWLHSKGFALPSVFVVQGSRGRIAAALSLDAVVDDTPENCLDVIVDSRVRPILVWRHKPEQVPVATARLGIAVVSTISECLALLTDFAGSSMETSDQNDATSAPHVPGPANR